MSGIAGIYHLDSRPVDPMDLQKMVDRMAHRGPDGRHVWYEGSVGLGHCMLRTTPESLHETFPMTSRCGNFVLTADARIDNRDDLISILRPPIYDDRPVTDGELILLAYEKWGEDCPKHLLGDFAFAIWDKRERRLFCARDHFGVKPLYYYVLSGCSLGLASHINPLFVDSDLHPEVNEERVADFLADICLDGEYTFYKAILRLPPGHCLIADVACLAVTSYYQLEPGEEISFGSKEQYAAKFREIFKVAVESRVRSVERVGSMLSGGLDSSAVTGMAQHVVPDGVRLKTFSFVYNELTQCDETHYINQVLCDGDYDPVFLAGDRRRTIDDLEQLVRAQEEPFMAPNASCDLYKVANSHGVRVLLSGHGGDECVSMGFGRLKELARAWKWLALAGELRPLSQAYGESLGPTFFSYIYYGLQGWNVRLNPVHLWKRLTGIPRLRGDRTEAEGGRVELPYIDEAFRKRVNLESRVIRAQKGGTARTSRETERHLRTLLTPQQSLALEVLDGFSSTHHVEMRFPFFDRRLVEYCLALPSEWKLSNGYTRYVMREALGCVLPDGVRWRRDKTDFSPAVRRQVEDYQKSFKDAERRFSSILRTYLDLEVINNAVESEVYRNGLVSYGCARLSLKTLVLALWLDTAELNGESRSSYSTGQTAVVHPSHAMEFTA